jgi:nitrite reductase/ring-hydroxylating ferredoxin subunit
VSDEPTTPGATQHPLGPLDDLADGEMRVFEDVGEYGIVVCRVGGELYALDDNCSHADTPLSEGRLRGSYITCPLHGAAFDVRDGTHSGPPAWTGVPCHAVNVVDGEAAVEIQPPKPNSDGLGGGMFETR